mmetsp:Transcript_5898/g.10139  ORF Transcript_5898/g.10139 Transcript_5898/m.10139 type:complete len:108 (-) Transcript_5898:113-436(-)
MKRRLQRRSSIQKKIVKRTANEKKLWVTGLPSIEDGAERKKLFKELQKHLSQEGVKCTAAILFKNGCGSAAFNSVKDVEKAMSTLNHTLFREGIIELDGWTVAEKKK